MKELEAEIARLDRLIVPGSGQKVETEHALRPLLELYGNSDEQTRLEIRELFNRYKRFRWGAYLTLPSDTPENFRLNLLHLSAVDHGSDTRDELLRLRDDVAEAKAAGVDINPILIEVAAMSSDVNRYGMGSMRQLLLACVDLVSEA